MTSTVHYQGNLRTRCEHLQSGNSFITDAPTDNNGKGEAFSPTDTVATALASCMFTIMGIKASQMQIDLADSRAEVTKVMTTDPRRISKIEIAFDMCGIFDAKTRQILENAAKTCPVWYSLHPDIEKQIVFSWK
ncbi:MAG: OsmC family protein [Flavobacteriaceae bacterium]|nr:OsmC family protein [Flavobacteriaceae bacterium]